MPESPSTSWKPSRARRSVTEFGSVDHIALKASGLHGTSSVQDRIKQWQEHGAASAPPPDVVSVLSAPRSEISTTPEPRIERVHAREKESDAHGRENRKSRRTGLNQPRQSTRIRSASTPRKRLVSDEHWKSQRSPKREEPTFIYDDGDIETVVPRSASPKSRAERPAKKTKAEREERRKRRVEAKPRKSQELAPLRDETAVDIHGSSDLDLDSNHRGNGYDYDVHADSTHDGVRTRSPSIEARSPSEFNSMMEQDEAEGQPRSKSRYVETLGRPPPAFPDGRIKSKKGSFLNKTKEVLGMSDPTPVMSSRLPSIEAWLDDQPDPFIDTAPLKVRFEDELSAPLKPHKSSKSHSVNRTISKSSPVVLDPNKIWDSIKDPPTQDRLVDQNHGVQEAVTETQQEPEIQSPTGLKRRGAKATRPKRHALPPTPVKIEELQSESVCDEQGTAPLSSKDSAERQCPPAGPTKLSTIVSVEGLHQRSQSDAENPRDGQYVIRGKITTDEDTMTVLSRPSLRKSARRKRSIKITNHDKNTDPIKEILEQLAEDEAKYSRELKTLVDGVIPVLLQCVLSKSDAAAAAEFFSPSPNLTHDLSFSRPIIDMGVALERLKTLHNRIPLTNVDQLFSWCQTAHKAYSEYLKAWRLAFQDIVINLAPLEGSDGENNEVMERDANGDIVDSEGETVDIAYLMKRPLVNIRKLGRALSCLQDELPGHPVAGKITEDYRELTAAAKAKHQKEKGRLEDEAAASIDSTKCRDIRNLAPLPGVSIDKGKRVRARDCFSMTLFHSTGQRMDCRIELIVRDNQRDLPEGGDLLVCQVEESGKWLLFAPSELSHISARKGESGCDLVIMIRGRAGLGGEWHELLALQAEDPEGVSEWLIMLGSNPLPPKLRQIPTLVDSKALEPAQTKPESTVLTESALRRVSSAETIDVPIGEPSVLGSNVPKDDKKRPLEKTFSIEKSKPHLSMGGGLQKKQIPEHWQTQTQTQNLHATAVPSSDQSAISGSSETQTSTCVPSSLAHIDNGHKESHNGERQNLEARQQQQHYRHRQQVVVKSQEPARLTQAAEQTLQKSKTTTEVRTGPIASEQLGTRIEDRRKSVQVPEKTPEQLNLSRAPASTPNVALPQVPKVRGNSSSNIPLTDAIRDTWSAISGLGRKTVSQPSTPTAKEKAVAGSPPLAEKTPERQNRLSSVPVQKVEPIDKDSSPPPPPQHRQIPVLRPRPVLQPSDAQIRMDKANGRMLHSPLRHEYNPDSASTSEESSSEGFSGIEDDSQTSEDEPPVNHHKISKKPVPPKHASQIPIGAPASVPTSAGTRTLAPSDSASQGPYRRVPGSVERPEMVKKRAVAMICSWNNDKGLWDPLVENYCSIVISPGLMEAFLMNEAHSNPSAVKQRPLAAFELTPWVPLRKGTGLDITIRSPSTPDSQIQTATNIMLRSHSGAECETLYRMINWARCNNPTYLELERSRPPPAPTVTFSTQEAPRPRSWFSFGGVKRRNSYRVGNIPPSSIADSQTTANTTSSAMSALKRLTKSSSFNVNRSSVLRKAGSRTSGSLYSSSNGTGLDSGQSTPPPSQLGMIPGKFGPNVPPTSNAALDGGGMVHNMRIRLQYRDSSSRWVTVGFSRLTILPAVKHSSDSPEVSRPGSSGSGFAGNEETSRRSSTITGSEDATQRQYRLPSSQYTPHRLHGGGREKRVVVTWERDPSQVMFDATLGESCFERISRLGIAVQVWRPKDEVRHRGSVLLGQNTKYLFIFKTHQECAWVFNIVGSYRYTQMGALSWEQEQL